MKLGEILLLAAAVLAVLAGIGVWQQKRHGEKPKDQDKVIDNVVDLNDRFIRARYMDQDQGNNA